jgi:hypothetical protein
VSDRTHARVPLALGAAAFAAYVATRAHAPTEWDSVQLVLGVDRFDVRQDSPHAPGYWAYVATGRVLRALTPLDAHASLTLASAIAAAITVVLVARLGTTLGGRFLGWTAATVVATTPFFWFYGATAASYAFDALASAVLMTLAWHARPGSWHGVAAAGALGVAGGFRQTALIVLFPLALLACARANRRIGTWVAAAAAGAAGVGAWLVPMVAEQPGGLREILHNDDYFWDRAASRTSVFAEGSQAGVNFRQLTAHTVVALGGIAVVGAAALVVVAGARARARRGAAPGPRLSRHLTPVQLLLVAAGPPFAFLALFHFGKSGYVLSFLPAAVLLCLWPCTRLAPRGKAVAAVGVALVAAVGVRQFLFEPGVLPERLVDGRLWFTRRENSAPFGGTRDVIRISDRYQEVFDEMRRRFDPERDVLVYVERNGGHWFRHATFALPEFTIHFHDGSDVLTARGGQYARARDYVVEVPPGGDAVFALDRPTEEIARLASRGVIESAAVPRGPHAWRVPPGVTVFGVEVREVPGAVDAPIIVRSPP